MIKPLFSHFLLILMLFCTSFVYAEQTKNERDVKREIRKLSSSLDTEKEKSDKIYSEMKSLEQKLGEIAKQKYQTEKRAKASQKKLKEAVKKKTKLKADLDSHKKALAQQLQALHSAGEQSHLRLLLKQDDPSDMSRTMVYYEYLNESRLKKIKKAQTVFDKYKKVEAEVYDKQARLQELTKEINAQEKDIKQLVAQRSRAFKKVQDTISGQEKRLSRLQEQEAKLQTVVNKVAEKEVAPEKPEKVEQDEPKSEVQDVATVDEPAAKKLTGKSVKRHDVPNKPLVQLKGKLSPPVAGQVIHRFGTKRNAHQKWNGVVLAAPEGRKVKAIAKGEVVFADWMDGYGYLIIIQHDNQHLSLYGYNRAIYKKEGSKVKANEVIAEVGSSGGQQQSALYFEIRKGRKPQNPKSWLKNL